MEIWAKNGWPGARCRQWLPSKGRWAMKLKSVLPVPSAPVMRRPDAVALAAFLPPSGLRLAVKYPAARK
jgi:hypothetical protein